MGFAGVFSTLAFIMIFSAAMVVLVSTQNTLTASATEAQAQQQRIIQSTRQDITITSSYNAPAQLLDWDTETAAEHGQGSFVNTTIVGDTVELANGELDGTYTGIAYDTGVDSDYGDISWTAVQPAGTAVVFRARSADDEATLLAAPFIGPDGTSATNYSATGTALHSSHDGDRWFQWQAIFDASVLDTATLDNVTIEVTRALEVNVIDVENTGKDKLHFEDTDVYIDGIRILREESARVMTWESFSDPQLWNPGETLTITAFANLTAPTTFTVANENARDQDVITP